MNDSRATPGGLSVTDFVARWKDSNPSERQSYQQHFIDICHVLGQPTPVEVDQEGTFFTFEKGVRKSNCGPSRPRRR